jgi:pimeloyl-ACP methyl ester carboxylesterase
MLLTMRIEIREKRKMPYADVNGARLSYESLGEGTPLLFIHGGYGGAGSTLAPQPHAIRNVAPRDKVRTIVYDRRNAGQSSYGLAHLSMATLAADALGLLDHLKIPRAIIVGSSAGGPIALQLALSAPERVIALGLPNTGANLASMERAQGKTRADLVMKSYAVGDRSVFEQRKAELRVPPPTDSKDPAELARLEKLKAALQVLSEEDLFRFSVGEIRNFEAYLNIDFSSRLTELRMAVQIVHGTADRVVPYAWGEALHRGIKQSELVPVDGADHGIIAYEAAAKAIREWVLRVIG